MPPLVLVLLLVAPGFVGAQAPDIDWFAGAYYDGDFFGGSSRVWTDWWTVRTRAYREMDDVTVGGEIATTKRFGSLDASAMVDAYADLAPETYLNLRGRVAPEADVLPLSDWRAEIFHTVTDGWELSAHGWIMNFPGPDVSMVGAGVARYIGAWYLRGRGTLVTMAGEETGSVMLQARRFLAGSRQYVEGSVGVGGEVVVVGSGPTLEVRDTRFLRAAFQRFMTRRLGIHLTAGLHGFEGIPTRRHLSLGIVARF